jgi:hypothetical protein
VTWGPIKLRLSGSDQEIFDGEASPAPGGGSMPVQGTYSGNAVTIANGASENLTWDTLAAGTELLNRSVPDSPLFLAAGTYAVSCSIQVSDLTANGKAALNLEFNSLVSAAYFPAYLVAPGVLMTITAVVVITDADLGFGPNPVLSVHNQDGAASRDFSIQNATIVKLS